MGAISQKSAEFFLRSRLAAAAGIRDHHRLDLLGRGEAGEVAVHVSPACISQNGNSDSGHWMFSLGFAAHCPVPLRERKHELEPADRKES